MSVVGDFNAWDPGAHPLEPRGASGIWEGRVDGARRGQVYKFAVTSADGRLLEKADPSRFRDRSPAADRLGRLGARLRVGRRRPGCADRGAQAALDAPLSVYEVHLGSWRRDPSAPDRLLSATARSPRLSPTTSRRRASPMSSSSPSWSTPSTDRGATRSPGTSRRPPATARPQDSWPSIDQLHQAGIGVILDWVPVALPDRRVRTRATSTAPTSTSTPIPGSGFHPDWDSYIFNYGRHEVRSFLLSSAEHWLSTYHADGLRVDAVASMLYLDYSRRRGRVDPQPRTGGRENLDAIDFLRQLNIGVYADHPDVQTIAEESTAWPGVSHPTEAGGLGFGYKWDMGWMHDTLALPRA